MNIEHDEAQEKAFAPLRELLLSHGGRDVIRREIEPNIADLLARGKLMDLRVKIRRGEPNNCHGNAAELWSQDPEFKLLHGYALSDGLWRQHSWFVHNDILYETTVKAGKYFGFELNDTEALRFWWDNHFPSRYGRIIQLMKANPAWAKD